MGLWKIYFNVDVKNAYNFIKERSEDYTNNGSILKDILMFASWFIHFDYGFDHSDDNWVADHLAYMVETHTDLARGSLETLSDCYLMILLFNKLVTL